MEQLIYTIEGSGTRSLWKQLQNVPIIKHCDEDINPADYTKIYTTNRNPELVRQTWLNRGLDFKKWEKAWQNWAKIKPYATVYEMNDLDYWEGANAH